MLQAPLHVVRGSAIQPPKPVPRFFRRQNLSRFAAVVLACWACMLSVPELYRVAGTLASLGLTVNADGGIVDVVTPFKTAAQSPAAQAGLQP